MYLGRKEQTINFQSCGETESNRRFEVYGGNSMKHECKITVLETKVFPDLQEKYLADPKSGPCPCFKEGDTFLLKRTP